MNKKALIITLSIIGVLLVSGGVFGALVLFGNSSESNTESVTKKGDQGLSKQEADVIPDLSLDLGACTIVTKTQITTALASYDITTISEGHDRGIADTGRGIKAQSCVFVFNNSTDINDRLTVTVNKFPNDATKMTALSGFTTTDQASGLQNQSTISSVGEAAFYGTSQDPALSINTYVVFVFKDDKQYDITLSRPSATDMFTATTAKTVLSGLVKNL